MVVSLMVVSLMVVSLMVVSLLVVSLMVLSHMVLGHHGPKPSPRQKLRWPPRWETAHLALPIPRNLG